MSRDPGMAAKARTASGRRLRSHLVRRHGDGIDSSAGGAEPVRAHPISGLPEIGRLKCPSRLKPTCAANRRIAAWGTQHASPWTLPPRPPPDNVDFAAFRDDFRPSRGVKSRYVGRTDDAHDFETTYGGRGAGGAIRAPVGASRLCA